MTLTEAALAAALQFHRERDEAREACRLAREAFRTVVAFGTNPDARAESRRALAAASAAVADVLRFEQAASQPESEVKPNG